MVDAIDHSDDQRVITVRLECLCYTSHENWLKLQKDYLTFISLSNNLEICS